jgi:flagellar hook-length control protein FliK
MWIFVLASPSISAAAVSNSLNNLPAKSSTPDNKPADGSPFAAMLAATATPPAKPQVATKPVSTDHGDAAAKDTGASATDNGAKTQASGDRPAAQAVQTQAVQAQASASGAGAAKHAGKDDGAANDHDGAHAAASQQTADAVQQQAAQPQAIQPQAGASGAGAAKHAGKDDSAANDHDGAHAAANQQTADAVQQQAAQPQAIQPQASQQPGPSVLAQTQLATQLPATPPTQTQQARPANDSPSDAIGGALAAPSAADISASLTTPSAAASPSSPGSAKTASRGPANLAPSAGAASPNAGNQTMADPAADPAQSDNFATQTPAADSSPVAAAQAAIKGAETGVKSATGDAPKAAPQANAIAAMPQTPQTAQPQPVATPSTANLATVAAAPAQTAVSTPASATVHLAEQSPNAAPDVNSLAVEIAARSQSGARQFDIRLDPPELGRVDVRLSIDASGKTEAHMTADQPETLNLLQKDSGTLTQALRDAGLDVSQNGLNFSLRGQSGQNSGNTGSQNRGPRSNLAATRVIDAAQTASSTSVTGGAGDTRLDIHV